ncbi:GNAT family N-acetyltransferase [Streptomyces sp. NPDC057445]|uniref:GNAT family N-acetyltransferase n=1 Tax=Streptomyces sp. NPDC057445 TaxID=3346136 RepID=UPI0036AFDBE0
MTVHVGEEDDALEERLGNELDDFNARASGAEVREFSARVTGDDGELIGGLTGSTWGECGFVDMLWVDAGHRHEGWGGKLLHAAEEEARARGCTRMFLSSYTFQAPPFYERLGYVETHRVEGMPGGHADVYLRKEL